MTTPNYQITNILDNYYTDGRYNYILTSSLYNTPEMFKDISEYAKLYIPNWQPVCSNPVNRLIFNSGTMFELIFYKNIMIVIQLYVSNYSVMENDLFHIKKYCENLIQAEDKKNTKLINAIGYKLYFYSCTTSHPRICYNNTSTTMTILNTTLYTTMYESYPFNLLETNYLIYQPNQHRIP